MKIFREYMNYSIESKDFYLSTPVSKSNKKPKGSISYDIKNSWIIGLKNTGYNDIAKYLETHTMSKPERMQYLREIEKTKYKNLFSDMEKWWLDKLNRFIEVNNIQEIDYYSHYYDEITIKSSKKINSLMIDGIEFSKERN